jgi:hypothetical protein
MKGEYLTQKKREALNIGIEPTSSAFAVGTPRKDYRNRIFLSRPEDIGPELDPIPQRNDNIPLKNGVYKKAGAAVVLLEALWKVDH